MKSIVFILCRQIDGIAPTFAQKPVIKQEEDGKRLRFECRILADPRPQVTWFHDGNEVKSGGRFRVCLLLTVSLYNVVSFFLFPFLSLEKNCLSSSSFKLVNQAVSLSIQKLDFFIFFSKIDFYNWNWRKCFRSFDNKFSLRWFVFKISR